MSLGADWWALLERRTMRTGFWAEEVEERRGRRWELEGGVLDGWEGEVGGGAYVRVMWPVGRRSLERGV